MKITFSDGSSVTGTPDEIAAALYGSNELGLLLSSLLESVEFDATELGEKLYRASFDADEVVDSLRALAERVDELIEYADEDEDDEIELEDEDDDYEPFEDDDFDN